MFLVINDRRTFCTASNWGISAKDGKSKGFALWPNGGYQTFLASFVSEKKWCIDWVRNFNPESIIEKSEIVFETPTDLLMTSFNKYGIKTEEYKWSKIKMD